jgi:hypothetical protein
VMVAAAAIEGRIADAREVFGIARTPRASSPGERRRDE